MKKILQDILDINSGNDFLSYIVERVQREDYRGIQISQHNRYTMEDVVEILKQIYKVVGDGFLPIPLGDVDEEGAQYNRKGEFQQYADVVKQIKKSIGKGTNNSLKKNFFVDWSRASLIDRFNKNKKVLDPRKRSHVHYAKLAENGIKLIHEERIIECCSLFSKSIDLLFNGLISSLAQTIYNSHYKNKSISHTEFQYILSDINKSSEEKISLLDSYRELKHPQKEELHRLLKNYCDPDRVEGDKTEKRDCHNWRNETQQIMSLLKNNLYFYFDVRETNICLNTGEFGIFPDPSKQPRQLGVKQEYFSKHRQSKIIGFDLHHIVPIKFADDRDEFRLIDSYKNLIYIQKEVHKKIKNDHLRLRISGDVVKFKDIHSKLEDVEARNNRSAMYKNSLAKEMMEHNEKILKEIISVRKNGV